MAVKKKAPKVKKYKTIQAATKSRTSRGSVTSRKVSKSYKNGSLAGGAGSLSDIIVRTINGIKVPISGSSSDKKKKR